SDLVVLTGSSAPAPGAVRAGAWWVSSELHAAAEGALLAALVSFHESNPLLEGSDLATARGSIAAVLERSGVRSDPGLVDAFIDELAAAGHIVREGSNVRLASHRVTLTGREEELERLVRAVADGEPKPPPVGE